MPPTRRRFVDTRLARSVSFGAPEAVAADRPSELPGIRPVIPVGPGFAVPISPALVPSGMGDELDGYPIQLAKVQRPPVRDQVLARDRLLDWLRAKIHQRVVLVIAEAGYGKTTLLADFSRRTRVRTLWYRLDDDDRSWISFLSHLVAAGREHDPGFAPITAAMLSETGISGPTRDVVLESLLHELAALSERGAAIVLDDYHLIDDGPDIKIVMRRLLSDAPERITFVLASRRQPTLPLARLRAQGEVAELSTDDLRFDAAETEQLFRDTFGRPLEPDVLAELGDRTEGWAASLQLVQAALRNRTGSEVRAFVRALSGAHGDLYDYLAEEVIGDLPEDLRDFLMRTSVLETVTVELAGIVTDLPRIEVERQMDLARRYGLFSRSAIRTAPSRYHPLVRDFLQERLKAELGSAVPSLLHRRIADYAENRNWRLACFHLAELGDAERVWAVLVDAIAEIMGRGDFAAAAEYLHRFPPTEPLSPFEIIRSRVAYRGAEMQLALESAELAMALDPSSDLALANLTSLQMLAGNTRRAAELALRLSEVGTKPELVAIGTATSLLLQSKKQSAGDSIVQLRTLAEDQLARGHAHYAGISLLNAAAIARATGDAGGGLRDADQAIAILTTSSAGAELASARTARAWALAHLGRLSEARDEYQRALAEAHQIVREESLLEAADVETFYGSADAARALLDQADQDRTAGSTYERPLQLLRAHLLLRNGRATDAAQAVPALDAQEVSILPGQASRHAALVALISLTLSAPDGRQKVGEALALGANEGASFWTKYTSLALELALSNEPLPASTAEALRADPTYASLLAELVIPRLATATPALRAAVESEVERRPERWRSALRLAVEDPSPLRVTVAGQLLEAVGTLEDVPRLRKLAKRLGPNRITSDLGRRLAKQLAPRVWVEDLGRVSIVIGNAEIPGTGIRRKVLALLCFLVSRPGFSATRDQVVDAIWPDFNPDVALNSLNQTVYFLRRVFDADYKEDLSPRYLHHDSDVLWLDQTVVQARSSACAEVLRRLSPVPTPEEVEQLSEIYQGRFALDFAYEEWASPYREWLHASYLQVVEAAVGADIGSGHFDRAIRLARRGLDTDPQAEQLEIFLLRLYRLTGAHAAAAEQYMHYATVFRENLGTEPPPLEAV